MEEEARSEVGLWVSNYSLNLPLQNHLLRQKYLVKVLWVWQEQADRKREAEAWLAVSKRDQAQGKASHLHRRHRLHQGSL